MGTYYVDNDMGATGGTGTQQDPYGIETAIAAASAGDTFYWRGGDAGDVAVGHTLSFNKGGSSTAPVRWIGTDNNWAPTPVGEAPQTGVDGNDGPYDVISISAAYQSFENVHAHNSLDGRNGMRYAIVVAAHHVILRNCTASDCQVGFYSYGQSGQIYPYCRAYDVYNGFDLSCFAALCLRCSVNDTESSAFVARRAMSLIGCRAHDVGGNGIEVHRDAPTYMRAFTINHCSVYGCVDGVKINAWNGTNANIFSVTDSIFDTCSGYAVNVTTPAGQMGLIANNASHNCSSGQVPTGRTGLINEGWIALSASPFVDAGNGDLSLVRGTPVIGAALDGGDLGAWQRKFARLPYPVTGLT